MDHCKQCESGTGIERRYLVQITAATVDLTGILFRLMPCILTLFWAFAGQEDNGPMKLDHGPGVAIYTALIINYIQLKGINAHYRNILL